MLVNMMAADQLRGLATRKASASEFKSVRHALVDEEVERGWTVQRRNKGSTRLRKPKPHDKRLEDRVWTLLYRMGFKFISGQGGAFQLVKSDNATGPDTQIDVVAIDDEVAFAVECKSSETLRRLTDFPKDLAKHVGLRDRFGRAVTQQFPGPVKRPSIFAFWTSGVTLSENDRIRAESERAHLLDERDLSYYEQLVDQVGSAARYQFLADLLPGRTVPGLEITVPAIRSKMGAHTAYTFSVPPEYLLKIAFVSHRAKGKPFDIDAYQRLLKKSRLKSIRQYISDGGIFPTNIVVNIADSKWLGWDRGRQEAASRNGVFGWLRIRPAYRIAWIIDGQHRLFAYANHPLAKKSLISVMAFVGLDASEQARLFVDINAQQRKVKQSLLQELYAELHWDAADPEVRIQAVLSKVVQALDTESGSPFRERILKSDDTRTSIRCISLTSVFRAMERGDFFIARARRGVVVEYGPLWDASNDEILKRTTTLLIGYFNVIRHEASELWEIGAGEGGGLSMNDGVTVCINVLRSIFYHLQHVKHIHLASLSNEELVEVVRPWAGHIGNHFASLSSEQMVQFRALRGVQGQTTGTRRLEEMLQSVEPAFDPPGLREFLDREKAQTTTRAFEKIQAIEQILQATVLAEIKANSAPRRKIGGLALYPKALGRRWMTG